MHPHNPPNYMYNPNMGQPNQQGHPQPHPQSHPQPSHMSVNSPHGMIHRTTQRGVQSNIPLTPKTPGNIPLQTQPKSMGSTPPGNPPPQNLPPSSQPQTSMNNPSSGDGKILTKQKLQDLSRYIDGDDRLDDEAIELITLIADEFVDSVTNFACKLAKHRKSQTLEVKDIQLHLEKNWNIIVPGFSDDDSRPSKKRPFSDSHRQRLIAVKKSKK